MLLWCVSVCAVREQEVLEPIQGDHWGRFPDEGDHGRRSTGHNAGVCVSSEWRMQTNEVMTMTMMMNVCACAVDLGHCWTGEVPKFRCGVLPWR